MKNKLLLFLSALFFTTVFLHAQDLSPQVENRLQNDFTLLGSENSTLQEFFVPEPPPAPVRTMAEWEELDGLVITWRPGHSDPDIRAGRIQILKEIITYAKEEVNVIIVCSSPTAIQDTLTNSGIDWSENVTFVEKNTNSIWIRDYGPNMVYANDVGERFFIDWIYNRPRPADDVVPDILSSNLGVPIYKTTLAPLDLVNTGGNFMSDGMGTAFSSKLVLNENAPFSPFGQSPHSEEDIDAIMQTFMGIDTYIKMDKLEFDGIHHIDMHMKLLDEETLLVGEFPEGVADGPQIEANIQYVLDNFTTTFGNPFNVIRIPMPPDANGFYPNDSMTIDFRNYTNAMIINNLILIPNYEEQYDTVAQRIWEEVMPGYKIQGINCNALIGGIGAIHCITKEIGIPEPLLINHPRVRKGCEGRIQTIDAYIQHHSGIQSAELFYTTDTTMGYTSVPMITDFINNHYFAEISAQPAGSEVYYYIHAVANDGKEINRPIPAPTAYFKYHVSPISECTVANENILLQEINLGKIYPNPASAITVVPVTSDTPIDAVIEVTDVLGRTVETIFNGKLPIGESNHFIQGDQYVTGTYFVSLKTENQSFVQKLVIK